MYDFADVSATHPSMAGATDMAIIGADKVAVVSPETRRVVTVERDLATGVISYDQSPDLGFRVEWVTYRSGKLFLVAEETSTQNGRIFVLREDLLTPALREIDDARVCTPVAYPDGASAFFVGRWAGPYVAAYNPTTYAETDAVGVRHRPKFLVVDSDDSSVLYSVNDTDTVEQLGWDGSSLVKTREIDLPNGFGITSLFVRGGVFHYTTRSRIVVYDEAAGTTELSHHDPFNGFLSFSQVESIGYTGADIPLDPNPPGGATCSAPVLQATVQSFNANDDVNMSEYQTMLPMVQNGGVLGFVRQVASPFEYQAVKHVYSGGVWSQEIIEMNDAFFTSIPTVPGLGGGPEPMYACEDKLGSGWAWFSKASIMGVVDFASNYLYQGMLNVSGSVGPTFDGMANNLEEAGAHGMLAIGFRRLIIVSKDKIGSGVVDEGILTCLEFNTNFSTVSVLWELRAPVLGFNLRFGMEGNLDWSPASTRLVVGARNDGSPGTGEVHVFTTDATASVVPVHLQTLTPPTAAQTGADTDARAFGSVVKLSNDGELLLASSPFDEVGGVATGSLSIYRWNGSAYALEQVVRPCYGGNPGSRTGFGESGGYNGIFISDDNLSFLVAAPFLRASPGEGGGALFLWQWDASAGEFIERGVWQSTGLGSIGDIFAANFVVLEADSGNPLIVVHAPQYGDVANDGRVFYLETSEFVR